MKRLELKGVPLPNADDFYAVTPAGIKPAGNFYFLSNDVLALDLESRRDHDAVICGVANPHFLHVIDLVSRKSGVRRIIAVDSNYEQLLHFQRLHSLIMDCANRLEYLQRLFKVTFNAKAINLLNSLRPPGGDLVRGGVERDRFYPLEQELWRNCAFDAAAFHQSYGLEARVEKGGLLIDSRTVGDIDTYYATFVCGSRSDYRHWPFTAAFGSGFLQDEGSFLRTRRVLEQASLYLLHGDFAQLYPAILDTNRYSPIYAWCSNLLCDYFLAKNPNLEEIATVSHALGTRVEPEFPEIDVVLLQDQRTRRALPEAIDNRRGHRRRWSVHTRNFAVVSRYLYGSKNLEVIGVRRWYDADLGASKLPNTEYCMLEEFPCRQSERYDSILLHILSGHCPSTDSYAAVLRQALAMTDNLVILEHNRLSREFRGGGTGITADQVRDILGAETFLDYGPGERSKDRNIIIVYRKCAREGVGCFGHP